MSALENTYTDEPRSTDDDEEEPLISIDEDSTESFPDTAERHLDDAASITGDLENTVQDDEVDLDYTVPNTSISWPDNDLDLYTGQKDDDFIDKELSLHELIDYGIEITTKTEKQLNTVCSHGHLEDISTGMGKNFSSYRRKIKYKTTRDDADDSTRFYDDEKNERREATTDDDECCTISSNSSGVDFLKTSSRYDNNSLAYVRHISIDEPDTDYVNMNRYADDRAKIIVAEASPTNAMADSDGTCYVNKSSEMDLGVICNPCYLDEDSKRVDSVVFCLECKEHLCLDCRLQHRRFKPTRNHHLIENDAEDDVVFPETRTCPEHVGKSMDYYCETHQVSCCKSCKDINHNVCPSVHYIPTECKDVTESPGIIWSQEHIVSISTKVQDFVKQKKEHIGEAKRQTDAALETINELVEKMTAKLLMMKKSARAEVHEMSAALTKTLTNEVETFENAYAALKCTEQKLNLVIKSGNKPQIFITLKETIGQIGSYKGFVTHVEESADSPNIQFKVDNEFEAMLKGVTSLGTVLSDQSSELRTKHDRTSSIQSLSLPVNSRRRRAIPIGGHSVRTREDRTTCFINGCKFLADERIVFSDYNNKCVKLFDAYCKFVNHVKLSSRSTDLIVAGNGEVATSLMDEHRIQFLTVGRMLQLGRSFDTIVPYLGLAYSNREEIFATCISERGIGEIHVLGMTGDLLRVIGDDPDKSIMIRPTSIHVLDERNAVYVIDIGQCRVLCFDTNPQLTKNEQPLYVYSDKYLELRNGITSDLDDNIYVASGNQSIHQISMNCQKVYEMLTAEHGIGAPFCLAFSGKDELFLVSEYKTNSVKLFKMEWV